MKKVLSVMLLLSMLTGMCSVGIVAQEFQVDDTYTLGDVNGDGESNAADALEVAKYLAGAEVEQFVRDAGDMNADGQVSAYDALQFRLCLAQAKDWSDYEITEGDRQALYNFTIAGNPIDTYSIVVPADTDPEASNAYYAAEEIQKYIRAATGCELEIDFGKQSKSNAICFHAVDEESELGERLDIEGYIYEVADEQLNIYGTRRGNMYAVYEILEEYLGYVFYSGEETVIYKKRTSDIPEGTYIERLPMLTFRMVRGGTFGIPDALEYYFPRRNNGIQLSAYEQEKYGTLTGPHAFNAHSFHYYYQMYTGPADAPTLLERFENGVILDQLHWQPCFTSDSTYEQLFTGLLLYSKYLFVEREKKDHIFRPGTSSLSFSICDNKEYCACADCSTIYATDGYAGGSVYIANRAAKDIQEYYPGMKIYFILYDHTIPQTIFPDENLIIMFCGTGCNNHFIGSGECGDNVTLLGGSNTYDEKALKAWGDICAQTGAELWFWYYPNTYSWYLTDCPNIINIYEDIKYLVNEYRVTGLYFESDEVYNNFEAMKEYLAARVIGDPDMTEEEFIAHMKEYLYLHYGNGYNELYEYILMQNEAGDGAGCFVNGYDRPRQMYDYVYIDEHYEEMRALLVTALEKANTDMQRERIETLIVCCDFLGLTCVHHRYYTNGDADSREVYMERYDFMYCYIRDNNIPVFPSDQYGLPAEISYTEDPMFQFYGAERAGVSRYP